MLKHMWAVVAVMLVGATYSGATALSKDFDHQAICDAIHQSKAIHLWYKEGEGERIIQPRFLGYSKSGNMILNGWQISGFSKSGKLPGHRSFRLDRITNMEFTNERVSSSGLSSGVPSGMVTLVCRVAGGQFEPK